MTDHSPLAEAGGGTLRVTFYGVRGSTPAPGPEFVRYGGNTSCVAIGRDGHDPTLVLDAGTGLQRLARGMGGRPFRGTILLTHLHWDHTHGLPFFPSGDHDGSDVTLLMPAQGDAEEVLERAISPPHFPIRPSGLRGRWRFQSLEPGNHLIEGLRVLAREIPHMTSTRHPRTRWGRAVWNRILARGIANGKEVWLLGIPADDGRR